VHENQWAPGAAPPWLTRPARESVKLESVTRAVIFDFYGTLARWEDSHRSNYCAVFADHGYELPDEVLEAYFARYDGVEHGEHSVSEQAYEAWVRHRLCDLTAACRVAPADQEKVVDALRASDQGLMVAYPDAASTLRTLRSWGYAIGVCSNWGWRLDSFLRQVALFDLVDAAITSARAGARKPHPSIYEVTTKALGVGSRDATFVGDSWLPDVAGPRRAGMTAVHLWRAEERAGQSKPESEFRVDRIGTLADLLPLLEVR
jgi:putative hydrolase of the HAD superfamily